MGNQTLQVYDAMDLRPVLTQLKAALDSLSGRGSGPAQITGQLAMNSNKITGVVNSPAPTSDEAVSYGTAQQQYGMWKPSVKTVRGNYPMEVSDGTILVDASLGPVTVRLPPITNVASKVYVVKKIDSTSNAVTITPSGTPQIDKKATFSITTSMYALSFQTDGANWWAF